MSTIRQEVKELFSIAELDLVVLSIVASDAIHVGAILAFPDDDNIAIFSDTLETDEFERIADLDISYIKGSELASCKGTFIGTAVLSDQYWDIYS